MKNKIITIMLALVIFFSSLTSVSAKALTIEEIDNAYKKLSKDEYDINVSTQIDKTNNKYSITLSGEESQSLLGEATIQADIKDGYIEYKDDTVYDNATTDTQQALEIFGKSALAATLVQATIYASGYPDMTISGDDIFKNFKTEEAFNTYGLYLDVIMHEKHESSEGYESNVSFEQIKDLKISMDTTKIDALILKYGEALENNNNNNNPETPEQPTEDKEDKTTESESKPTEEVKEEKHYENPETGAFLPTSMIIGLSVIAAVLIILARRYTSFRRI